MSAFSFQRPSKRPGDDPKSDPDHVDGPPRKRPRRNDRDAADKKPTAASPFADYDGMDVDDPSHSPKAPSTSPITPSHSPEVESLYGVAPDEYSEVNLLSIRWLQSDLEKYDYHNEIKPFFDAAREGYHFKATQKLIGSQNAIDAQNEANDYLEQFEVQHGRDPSSLSILHLNGHGGGKDGDLTFSGTRGGPKFPLGCMLKNFVEGISGSLLIVVGLCHAGMLSAPRFTMEEMFALQGKASKWFILASPQDGLAYSGEDSMTKRLTWCLVEARRRELKLTPGSLVLLCRTLGMRSAPFASQLNLREDRPLEIHPCYNTLHKRIMKDFADLSDLKDGQILAVFVKHTRGLKEIDKHQVFQKTMNRKEPDGDTKNLFRVYRNEAKLVSDSDVVFRMGRTWIREGGTWNDINHRIINRVVVFEAHREVVFGE